MQAPNPKLQQAIQHHQNGQLNEAITLYKELIQEGGAIASVYSNLSGALSQQGKPKEAIELLNSAISSFPNDIGMALSLGQTYLSVGDLNNARQLANSILLKFPTQGEAHFILGNIFLKKKNSSLHPSLIRSLMFSGKRASIFRISATKRGQAALQLV